MKGDGTGVRQMIKKKGRPGGKERAWEIETHQQARGWSVGEVVIPCQGGKTSNWVHKTERKGKR